MLRPALLPSAVVAALIGASPAAPQSLLERTPNLDAAWTGTPGSVYVIAPQRFRDTPEAHLVVGSTFDLSFALPRALLLGVRFAPESRLDPTEDEYEPYVRWTPLVQAAGGIADVGASVGYSSALDGVAGSLALSRWMGPLRILAEGRALTDPSGDGVELAAGGGGVLHVMSGRMPVALSGDYATLLDRPEPVDAVWSAGLHIGIPFTQHTLSLHASNAPTTTLAGRSFGSGETFYGFELTIPLGVGALFGMYAPREVAVRAVVPDSTGPVALRARIARYAFEPLVVEIDAGDVVEWTNVDAVLHTVNAEDGAWHSGAIEPGASWRARFDEPGRYPFYCGPHPFMKGIVVVR